MICRHRLWIRVVSLLLVKSVCLLGSGYCVETVVVQDDRLILFSSGEGALRKTHVAVGRWWPYNNHKTVVLDLKSYAYP